MGWKLIGAIPLSYRVQHTVTTTAQTIRFRSLVFRSDIPAGVFCLVSQRDIVTPPSQTFGERIFLGDFPVVKEMKPPFAFSDRRIALKLGGKIYKPFKPLWIILVEEQTS